MVEFWEPVVRPLLEAAAPRVIVEVGAFNGDTTAKLLEFASARDCVVHSIDPGPGPEFDPSELNRRYGDRLVFHRRTSLEALPRIDEVDAALIDGDHNWYTVYNELTLLATSAAEQERDFPLTLLHDVDWPYGRRDMYYDPDAIPEEHRHPFRRAGLIPGRRELADSGGINAHVNNALLENDARSGVRTAIEDFLAETELPLRFQSVTGGQGLGILVSEPQLERNDGLSRVLGELAPAARP